MYVCMYVMYLCMYVCLYFPIRLAYKGLLLYPKQPVGCVGLGGPRVPSSIRVF